MILNGVYASSQIMHSEITYSELKIIEFKDVLHPKIKIYLQCTLRSVNNYKKKLNFIFMSSEDWPKIV